MDKLLCKAFLLGFTVIVSCDASAINRTNFEAQTAECTTGQSRMMDCNYCTCMGSHWGCTEMDCPPNNQASRQRQQQQQQQQQQVCREGETRRSGECNTCWCRDGRWTCTQMRCDNNVTPSHVSAQKECTSGERKEDNCNTCWCNNNKWACTHMDCSSNAVESRSGFTSSTARNHQQRQCMDNDMKMEDCNQCRCSNGIWDCTRMTCPNDDRRQDRRQSHETQRECRENDMKMLDCNRCWCSEGRWSCTSRKCSS